MYEVLVLDSPHNDGEGVALHSRIIVTMMRIINMWWYPRNGSHPAVYHIVLAFSRRLRKQSGEGE